MPTGTITTAVIAVTTDSGNIRTSGPNRNRAVSTTTQTGAISISLRPDLRY